jgi:hypothetical protein
MKKTCPHCGKAINSPGRRVSVYLPADLVTRLTEKYGEKYNVSGLIQKLLYNDLDLPTVMDGWSLEETRIK